MQGKHKRYSTKKKISASTGFEPRAFLLEPSSLHGRASLQSITLPPTSFLYLKVSIAVTSKLLWYKLNSTKGQNILSKLKYMAMLASLSYQGHLIKDYFG